MEFVEWFIHLLNKYLLSVYLHWTGYWEHISEQDTAGPVAHEAYIIRWDRELAK